MSVSRGTIRLAYVLLGLMSLASFGGPFAIGAVLKGGDSPNWPPDRPIEWTVSIGVTAVVLGVFIGLTVLFLANLKSLHEAKRLLDARRQSVMKEAADRDRDRGGA
jgi:uncharacterized membrane protein (DUF106 family)